MTEMDVAKLMLGWANVPSTTMLEATTIEASNVRYGTVIAANEDGTYDVKLDTGEVITVESETPLSVGDRVSLVNQDGSFVLYGMSTFVGESRESASTLAKKIEDKGREIEEAAAKDLAEVEKAFSDFKEAHKLTDEDITRTITETNGATVETFEARIEDLGEVYTTKSEFTKGLNDLSSSMSETYQSQSAAGTMEQNLSSLISQNTKAIQTEVSERTTAVSGALSEAKSYTDQSAEGIKTTVQKTVMDEVGNKYALKTDVEHTAEGVKTTIRAEIGEAETRATNAAAAAKGIADTNASFIETYFDETIDGFTVGSSASQYKTRMGADSVDILDSSGNNVLASFSAKLIELGKKAADAMINLCEGAGIIKAHGTDGNEGIAIMGGSSNVPTIYLDEDGVSLRSINAAEFPESSYAYLDVNSDGTISMEGDESSRPTWNGVELATVEDVETAAGGNYLPKSGGTMTGTIYASGEPDLGSDTSRWKRLFTKAAYFANAGDTASAYKFGIAQWNDKLEVTTRDAGDNGVKSVAFTVNGSDGKVDFNERPTHDGVQLATVSDVPSVDLSGYLPLSGGTVTGDVTFSKRPTLNGVGLVTWDNLPNVPTKLSELENDGEYVTADHAHDASAITSGTLPLANGGTGTALSRTNNAIIRFSGSGNYFSKTATANGAFYATAANGSPKFGTLPIAQGGTGATDAATALANIGAAAAEHTHDQYLTAIPSEYVTETELDAKGYLTAHQDLSEYATKTELNKKADDYSIEMYNGNGGTNAVKFAYVNYSTCGSENGVAALIRMVCGHGNGSSYAFMQDAIIKVTHTGSVSVDNFKYYGAAATYDGSRQYGDIFWVVDTDKKIVHLYCIMGQYSRLYQTPWKRLTYSSGGTVIQSTSASLYSSGTKAWANNSEYALLSDLSSYATQSWVNTQIANAGGGSVSIPTRLASYQDHTVALADPNSAVETGFYYINTATNRPPFSQSSNVDYRVLTTAYSDQWLQQIATDFRCPDMFIRRRENGTWTSWVKIMSEEGGRFTKPISFQDSSMPGKALEFVCGIDAFAAGGQMGWQSKGDFLAGYATTAQLGNYLPLSGGTITNRLYANEWIQFNNQCGLYFPNHNGLHIMPNDVSSYTPLRIIGTRGGYNGAIFGDDKTGLHVMSQATHQGFFNESTGKWIVHYNRDTGTISFGANDAGSANVNVSGSFFSSGKMYQGSTSSDASIASMNRFESDLYVQGNGTAPNGPTVAGFYLGKSTSDENRHMDIVSGGDYSYIDFNKAGRGSDYDVRLLVNVTNGLTDLCWGSVTNPTFNVSGNLTVGGSNVVTAANVSSYLANSSAAVISPFNASGTNGNVTLTSSAANYSILEIFYTDGSRIMSQRVYSPNNRDTILQRSVYSSTSAFYDGSAIIEIRGTSITWKNQGRLVIGTGSAQTVEADTATLKIVCVLGWK